MYSYNIQNQGTGSSFQAWCGRDLPLEIFYLGNVKCGLIRDFTVCRCICRKCWIHSKKVASHSLQLQHKMKHHRVLDIQWKHHLCCLATLKMLPLCYAQMHWIWTTKNGCMIKVFTIHWGSICREKWMGWSCVCLFEGTQFKETCIWFLMN